MAAKPGRARLPGTCRREWDESGQSLIEFLFLLPVLLGLAFVLLRVNSAIQISIVNQKYARAQVTWLTFNHPHYPETFRLSDKGKGLVPDGANRMALGVGALGEKEDGSGDIIPEAQVQIIARTAAKAGPPGPVQEETNAGLGQVRVRNTVALCTKTFVVGAGGGNRPLDNQAMVQIGLSRDPTAFQYCATRYDE